MSAALKKYLMAWTALCAFVGLQASTAYLPIDGLSRTLALVLAWLMVAMIAGLLMAWRRAPALAAMFALIGVFWTFVLFGLGTDNDVAWSAVPTQQSQP